MKFESINEVCIKWRKDIDNAILGEIKRKAIEHGIKTEYILNEKAIISALKKQIPKKPYLLNYGGCEVENWHCPNGHIVSTKDAFCKHCGQALDWSDTE